jgi:hypothetical protein
MPRALAGFLIAVFLIAGLAEAARAADGPDAADRVGLILSKLPKRGTVADTALRKAAGLRRVQKLEMTGTEMWSIARGRLAALRTAADAAGVEVLELTETWDHLLLPMSPGVDMTAAQHRMMEQAMASKATMGVTMMALPPSRVLEYAMTRGEQGGASGVPSR